MKKTLFTRTMRYPSTQNSSPTFGPPASLGSPFSEAEKSPRAAW
jgi:hypothetical protein